MGITIQRLCENCSKLLKGRNGSTFTALPRLQIKGVIMTQNVDPDTGYESWTYLTTKANSDLEFCDTACFAEWVAFTKERMDNRHREDLRAVATNNYLDRMDPKTIWPNRK